MVDVNKPEFQEGLWAEEQVMLALREDGHLVTQTKALHGGVPYLIGKNRKLILPDLDVCMNGGRFWGEVKARTPNRGDYGIQIRNFTHYKEVQTESGTIVCIFILDKTDHIIRAASLDELEKTARPAYSNLLTGPTYFWPVACFTPMWIIT